MNEPRAIPATWPQPFRLEVYKAGADWRASVPPVCTAFWGASEWSRHVSAFHLPCVDVTAPGLPVVDYWKG